MSEQAGTICDAALVESARGQSINTDRLRWLELLIVFLISFANSILGSIYVLSRGQSHMPNVQTYTSANGILHESICLLLLGYVLSRRGLRIADIGFRWSITDIGRGLIVAIVADISYKVGIFLLNAITLSNSPTGSHVAGQALKNPSLLAIPYFLLNPFFEELIVRAYLMTEIRALTKSWTLAVVLSVAVQTSYHLYYGWTRALSLSFLFVVFSIYYARRQKATPLIVAHGVFDIYSLIRFW